MKRQSPKASNRSSPQQRKALISYALFRWESAVILSIMLILAVFLPDPFGGRVVFWGRWVWIALGLIAELLIVGTTLSDPDMRARIASQVMRDRFDLGALSDAALRGQIARVLDVREQMEKMVHRTRDAGLAAQMRALVDDVTNWIAAVYSLATRMDDYVQDGVLRRNRSAIPAAIRALEAKLTGTISAQERAKWEKELAEKQSTWAQLEHLDRLVKRAAAHLDESESALQRVYTQMQLSAAREASSSRAGRAGRAGQLGRQWHGDIAEYVRSLTEAGQEIAESHYQVLERA